MKIRKIFVSLVTAGLALSAYVSAVGAAEISGVKFEDKITVAGKTLVLNGLGVRQILFLACLGNLWVDFDGSIVGDRIQD